MGKLPGVSDHNDIHICSTSKCRWRSRQQSICAKVQLLLRNLQRGLASSAEFILQCFSSTDKRMPVQSVSPVAAGPQLKPLVFLIMFCSLRLFPAQTCIRARAKLAGLSKFQRFVVCAVVQICPMQTWNDSQAPTADEICISHEAKEALHVKSFSPCGR